MDKRHIKQQPDDNYPQPGIPADSAWDAMKDMLDNELPSGRNGSASSFGGMKLILLISGLLLTCAGIFYLATNRDIEKKNAPSLSSSARPGSSKQENGVTPGKNIHDNKAISADGKMLRQHISAGTETQPTRQLTSDSTALNEPDEIDSASEKDIKTIAPQNDRQKETTKTGGTSKKQRNNAPLINNAIPASQENETAQNQLTQPVPEQKTAKALNKDYGKKSQNNLNQLRINAAGNIPSAFERDNSLKSNTQQITTSGSTFTLEKDASQQKRPAHLALLAGRPVLATNRLTGSLKAIQVKPRPGSEKSTIIRKSEQPLFWKTMHTGLTWNFNVPSTGYTHYFRGISSTNVSGLAGDVNFYKVFLPGIWVGKEFKNGSELILTVKPYNQYFGNKNTDTSRVAVRDSAKSFVTTTRGLIKSTGPSLGIHYNQHIYGGWSVGAGATIQWQKKALLSNYVKSSKKDSVIRYEPFVSVVQKTDTSGYLRPYFFTANLEVLYSWKNLQFGAGILVPVSGMTATPYMRQKPVSGQVTVRWRLK